MIALLSSRGVDCDPNRAEDGWPPIVFQSRGDRGGRVDRIRDLVARGADVNARNYKGQTALHCAARAGFVEIVSLLLEHGAEVDLRDRAGHTPLMTALRSRIKNKNKLREVVRVLTEAGQVWMNNELTSGVNQPDQ
ncbi:MAG: ankyrin repeat domain-containing protein [Gemmatimonadetes bacterium]|nr:ankyrin repeat domain-containing protein [Gemmatimonadota bacterium]